MVADFLTGLTILAAFFYGGGEPVQPPEQELGAVYIRSLQLAASPSNGLVLKTNGTDNYWDTDATGGGAGGTFPFSADTNFAQVVYSTSTPTLWFKSGMFASSTSWFTNTITGNATATNATTTKLHVSSVLNFGGDLIDELVGTGLALSSGDLTLNLANNNSWTGQQTFSTLSPIFNVAPTYDWGTQHSIPFIGVGRVLTQDTTNLTFNDSTNLFTTYGASTTNVTSSYASSTSGYYGLLSIGSSTPTFGPFTVDVSGDSEFGIYTGTRNSFMQLALQNRNSGSDASTDLVLTNDLGSPNAGVGYYLDCFINSSTYSNALYSSGGPNDGGCYNNDGNFAIGTASTTATNASLQFVTGGFTSSNIRSTITRSGFFGIGTTTPRFTLQIASSTASQLVLSDASLTSNHWAMRNAGGNLYFATSSPNTFATSTQPAFWIDTNAIVTFLNKIVTFSLTATGLIDFGDATSMELPNGSAPVVDAIGETALDTTANELLYATSTASGAPAVLKPYRTYAFSYASTTQGSGTTTRSLGPVDGAGYFTTMQCDFNNFMRVMMYDGTNRMDDLVASSTIGTVKFTTNQSFTSGEALRVDIGTTTNIASNVFGGCRAKYIYTRN